MVVSTHSRPKAAAMTSRHCGQAGSVSTHSRPKAAANAVTAHIGDVSVSTHSRPKAAAFFIGETHEADQSFNSQPPEGGCVQRTVKHSRCRIVSTHSRPKAAAHVADGAQYYGVFQLTAARRRLLGRLPISMPNSKFQLTAARRRLPAIILNSEC